MMQFCKPIYGPHNTNNTCIAHIPTEIKQPPILLGEQTLTAHDHHDDMKYELCIKTASPGPRLQSHVDYILLSDDTGNAPSVLII